MTDNNHQNTTNMTDNNHQKATRFQGRASNQKALAGQGFETNPWGGAYCCPKCQFRYVTTVPNCCGIFHCQNCTTSFCFHCAGTVSNHMCELGCGCINVANIVKYYCTGTGDKTIGAGLLMSMVHKGGIIVVCNNKTYQGWTRTNEKEVQTAGIQFAVQLLDVVYAGLGHGAGARIQLYGHAENDVKQYKDQHMNFAELQVNVLELITTPQAIITPLSSSSWPVNWRNR